MFNLERPTVHMGDNRKAIEIYQNMLDRSRAVKEPRLEAVMLNTLATAIVH
jgi:hypothetical protein